MRSRKSLTSDLFGLGFVGLEIVHPVRAEFAMMTSSSSLVKSSGSLSKSSWIRAGETTMSSKEFWISGVSLKLDFLKVEIEVSRGLCYSGLLDQLANKKVDSRTSTYRGEDAWPVMRASVSITCCSV